MTQHFQCGEIWKIASTQHEVVDAEVNERLHLLYDLRWSVDISDIAIARHRIRWDAGHRPTKLNLWHMCTFSREFSAFTNWCPRGARDIQPIDRWPQL